MCFYEVLDLNCMGMGDVGGKEEEEVEEECCFQNS